MTLSKRTYLTYLFNDEPITLAFRSQEGMNTHIEYFKIHKNKILCITNKRPLNPEITDASKHQLLELFGEKTYYPSLWSTTSNKSKTNETMI